MKSINKTLKTQDKANLNSGNLDKPKKRILNIANKFWISELKNLFKTQCLVLEVQSKQKVLEFRYVLPTPPPCYIASSAA